MRRSTQSWRAAPGQQHLHPSPPPTKAQAAGGCCTRSSWALCDPLSARCNREAPGPKGASYIERESDRQNGVALRAVMYGLGATGRLASFPRASEGGILIEGGTNGSRGVPGLRKIECAYWSSHNLGRSSGGQTDSVRYQPNRSSWMCCSIELNTVEDTCSHVRTTQSKLLLFRQRTQPPPAAQFASW